MLRPTGRRALSARALQFRLPQPCLLHWAEYRRRQWRSDRIFAPARGARAPPTASASMTSPTGFDGFCHAQRQHRMTVRSSGHAAGQAVRGILPAQQYCAGRRRCHGPNSTAGRWRLVRLRRQASRTAGSRFPCATTIKGQACRIARNGIRPARRWGPLLSKLFTASGTQRTARSVGRVSRGSASVTKRPPGRPFAAPTAGSSVTARAYRECGIGASHERCEFLAGGRTGLGHRPVDVAFHGAFRQRQTLSDLRIGQAVPD